MIKLHLGCGKRYLPGFVHIDMVDFPHIDYKQNVKDIHQFEDNSVDLIYASHVLEYFDRSDIDKVLKIWYNKLRGGGILRLSVPDFLKLKWVYENTGNIEDILGPLYGKWESDGRDIYHKIVFTNKSLTKILKYAGFKEVRPWDWRKIHDKDYDDHSMAHFGASIEDIKNKDFDDKIQISLNIEAIK